MRQTDRETVTVREGEADKGDRESEEDRKGDSDSKTERVSQTRET